MTFKCNLSITVGKPSKKLNSVSFSRSYSFTKMYFNTNLVSTIKKETYIELEHAIICRVLLSRSRINIALNTTSSFFKE